MTVKYVVGLDAASARIFMWTSQRLAEVGQDAQLYCRASGSPPPTVTWYYSDDQERMSDQEIIPDDNQYKVTVFEFILPSLVVIIHVDKHRYYFIPLKTGEIFRTLLRFPRESSRENAMTLQSTVYREAFFSS